MKIINGSEVRSIHMQTEILDKKQMLPCSISLQYKGISSA